MNTKQRFNLGQLLVTPGALEFGMVRIMPYVFQYAAGNWGDLDGEDVKANEAALVNGGRLFSSYKLADLGKIWVITEVDRSVTTVLLPSEY